MFRHVLTVVFCCFDLRKVLPPWELYRAALVLAERMFASLLMTGGRYELDGLSDG